MASSSFSSSLWGLLALSVGFSDLKMMCFSCAQCQLKVVITTFGNYIWCYDSWIFSNLTLHCSWLLAPLDLVLCSYSWLYLIRLWIWHCILCFDAVGSTWSSTVILLFAVVVFVYILWSVAQIFDAFCWPCAVACSLILFNRYSLAIFCVVQTILLDMCLLLMISLIL